MTFLKNLLVGLVLLSFGSDACAEWNDDVLSGYEALTIDMADDYSGKVVTTVVRRKVNTDAKMAFLYLHGYNDYFFQKELGDSVVAHGIAFYAVDLRKYGRSILDGQRKFEVRSLDEYFADIDAALAVIARDGYSDVILNGHSTGGLILSYYLSKHKDDRPNVKALILNSPFLDMNLSKFQERFLVPLVSFLPFKKINIKQGDSKAYAESLLSCYHGEWCYNTDWKTVEPQPVTTGWITAIHKAQRRLHKKAGISIPILLMHSNRSVGGYEWSPAFNTGDGVLDVNDITKYGKKLGPNVEEFVVEDGMHDLILSRKDVRDRVYRKMFEWLSGRGL